MKNFEFFEKKIYFYNYNRNWLKFNFNLYRKKKIFLNKFFKKILKLDILNFINVFEYSVFNVLLNSNFFLNKKDLIFFLKNGFIYINNTVVFNYNLIIKENDVLNICYNKYYFFLYRTYIENVFNSFGNSNFFFRKINNIEDNNLKREFKFINKIVFF